MPYEELGKLPEPEAQDAVFRELTVLGRIKSRSYAAGASGWQIEGDGSAEFNNVTVRGALFGTSGSLDNMTLNDLSVAGTLTMTGAGSIIRTGSGSTRVELQSSFTDRVAFYFNSNLGYIAGTTGNTLQFVPPGGSVEMSIAAAQTDVNNPLHLSSGSAGSPGLAFQNDTDTGLYLSGADLVFTQGGTARAYVRSTGLSPWADDTYSLGHSGRDWVDLFVTNAPTVTSDRGKKKNIRGLNRSDAVNIVRAIEPKAFSWKKDDTPHFGFVAQDVAAVLPPNNGVVVDKGDSGLGLRHGELLPLLWEAVRYLLDKP